MYSGSLNVQSGEMVVVSVLLSSNTTKGETWKCSVRYYDGINYEAEWNNQTITIQNTPPLTTNMVLNSTTVWHLPTDNLYCWAEGNDNDPSDSLMAYYRWYNGPTLVMEGHTSIPSNTLTVVSTLLSGNTSNGDRWECHVLMSDGYDNESLWNARSIDVINNLPHTQMVVINSSRNLFTLTV